MAETLSRWKVRESEIETSTCLSLFRILSAQNAVPASFVNTGTVSPPDTSSNLGWANTVFISTIRHPVSRIISAIRNEHKCSSIKNCTRFRHRGGMQSRESMMKECSLSTYFCKSNYFVRLFSGQLDYNLSVTEDTVEAAKDNFRRYSCVLIQEAWEATLTCDT